MRKTAVSLALILVASLGIAVPSVAAATNTDPKVVIIVGATHGMTASYRLRADQAYAEAIKYTSNVVKVYSPNATWAKVKAATVGASIVIYMGHGNGWPSPYTYDPLYTTKDGFGLNATAGAGDYNNKYYGEPYVATLDLAPGAIVMLHHLCYAAGNSEPGNAEPSVSVARQRAVNYAAGFLKAGAAAVLVDGHAGPASYLRDLFTTHQSLVDMWRDQPNANGNVVSFASSRTAGATAFQDPNTPTSGFYRSLVVASTDIGTDDVVNGGVGDTSLNPAALTVPGNAAVMTDGAGLFSGPSTSGTPDSTLPAGTRLRVVDQATSTSAEGTPLVEVQGLDDPRISGFIVASDVAARDSSAPVVRSLNVGGGLFSPNDDGVFDNAVISARFTETVAWTLDVLDGADVLYHQSGNGSTFETSWDGLVNGDPVADGAYTVRVSGVDPWQNPPANTTRTLRADTAGPSLTAVSPDAATVQWFSPNGDANRETVTLNATNSEAGSLSVRVLNVENVLVRKFSVANGTGPTAVIWDGRGPSGGILPDGDYRVRIAPLDSVGNAGTAGERTVRVINALRSVVTSRALFYPQDLDNLAKTTTLSFTLARPMNVTWTLRNAAGAIVDTHLDAVDLPAGAQTWVFDGRGSDGTMLPTGRYSSYLSATDGTLTATQSVAFDAEAFVLNPSDATPGRGQLITMRMTTAEALSSVPRVYISQPGVSLWSVAMSRTSSTTYKATFRLKTAGRSGTVSFQIRAKDANGVMQRTTKSYRLH